MTFWEFVDKNLGTLIVGGTFIGLLLFLGVDKILVDKHNLKLLLHAQNKHRKDN